MKTSSDTLLEAISHSDTYRSYELAFVEATGMPMTLRPLEAWKPVHHHRKHENRFCALMAQKSRACAACLQIQQKLSDSARQEPRALTCHHGMCDAAVVVKSGDRLVGLLQTGQVFTKRPTEAQFERTLKLAREWGVDVERDELKKAYFGTQVLSVKQFQAMLQLLNIFGQHLSMVANGMMVQRDSAEPPVIRKAKEYMEQHHTEDLSLGQVAQAVHMSSFYFCKIFKKATGINFTDYLSRLRIEKAKNLLLNPNVRISEIAYEVGFQSLTHFNRVFKRVVGQSPTAYREQLPKGE
jgi:AraC-like DNA-binding protein/ligand-binding sensor protein